LPHCPKCGQEVAVEDNFCRQCGLNLKDVEYKPEDEVRGLLIKRMEGIKNRDSQAITSLVDRERYTKFDDWPPFTRQGPEALDREAEALEVLKEYEYKTSDWRVDLFDDAAVATFTVNYRGRIRDLSFDITSRVTALLLKQEDSWRIVHEHWSRFPGREQGIRRRRRWLPF